MLQRFSRCPAFQQFAQGCQLRFFHGPVKLGVKSRAVAVQDMGQQMLHGGACLVAPLAGQIIRAGLKDFQ